MVHRPFAIQTRPAARRLTGRDGVLGAFLGAVLVLLGACQTASLGNLPPDRRPATVYSGYFIWDSERQLGNLAVQCMQLVFDREEPLTDGRIRLNGVTRYITGPDDEINFVETEMVYDPSTGTFTLWESNPTSSSFVVDGSYEGRFKNGTMFLEAEWHGNQNAESGRIVLRQGGDAPCLLEQDA
ncbi:MAG: hypothetical protein RIM33_07735 [Alphaproteobacteria bacterium]